MSGIFKISYLKNLDLFDFIQLAGTIEGMHGSLELALKHLSKAKSIYPIEPSIHSDLGRVLDSLGRLQESRVALKASLKLNPNQPKVCIQMGKSLLKSDFHLRACKWFSRFGVGSKFSDCSLLFGTNSARFRSAQKAEEHFQMHKA